MKTAVLVADDDEMIRKGIINILETHFANQFEIFQAENGQQALSFVCAQSVNLILSDVKMPVMSGVELLEKLRQLHFEGEVIMISGYDDYALVRQTMKMGAADYLLKPIAEDDLVMQLKGALMRMSYGRPSAPTAVFGTGDIAAIQQYRQQYLLEQLLSAESASITDALSSCHLTHEHRMILCAVELDEHNNRMTVMHWQEQLTTDAAALQKHLCLISGHWQQYAVTLLFFASQMPPKQINDLLKSMKANYPQVLITKQVSATAAAEALDQLFMLVQRRFYNLSAVDGDDRYPYASICTAIKCAVCHLDTASFDHHFQLLLMRVCAQMPPVTQFRQLLVSVIYSVLQNSSAFVRVVSNAELTNDDAIACAQEAPDCATLSREFTRIIHAYVHKVHDRTAASGDFHVEHARQFIEQHYAENITLADVAEHLALHPNYVSTLFKKDFGVSFSQHLRHVRIEEACRAIRESDEKLYIIASNVSYDDPASFGRAFREEMNCSPREYKQKFFKAD